MPVGYWWTVAVTCWGVMCALTRWRRLGPRGDMPPMLVVHGEKDLLASASGARAFVAGVRAVSSHPVIYAELPGAHHDFDMFESIRAAAVSQAVEQFTANLDLIRNREASPGPLS